MRKLLSFAVILSLLLTFAFPVAQAGTITQKVQAAINKIDYITADEFVTSLLIGAKVKPDKPLDYWGKAVKMGLIPQEVKKDRPITRAQASYIVWKLINAVPELKNKNIPVSVRRVPPTEAFMRGICFFGGPGGYENEFGYVPGYDLDDFIQGYQLLILEYKYADGLTTFKYVWDRYKGIKYDPVGGINKISKDFLGLVAEFKKKYPDKVVYAPRPWQKGWMFAMDIVRDTKGIPATIDASVHSSIDYARQILTKAEDVISKFTKLGYPITREDIAQINYGYYFEKKGTTLKGYYGYYDIKEHPYFNMYLEDFLINYPRKYPTDHTRFAYYCKDYSKIPQLYREPMLHLADLGIITPDQSALYIGVYYFNAGKTLTRAEAVQMITRVFDKSKRDVLDEVSVKSSAYWIPEANIGTGRYMIFEKEKKKYTELETKADESGGGVSLASTQALFRIEELKSMRFVIMAKNVIPNKYVSEKGFGSFSIAETNSMLGSIDLAELNFNGQSIVLYDEFDYPKIGICDPLVSLWDYPKTKLLAYVAPAYRDELQKDLNYYTFGKIKSVSKSNKIIKQYGDVFIVFNAAYLFGANVVKYELYTVLPLYFTETREKNYYVFLSPAKPNSKYTQ
ncbi:hypothetical protein [Anaerocellum diazotrophicum]|uniref:SLH domain-containing protein n=1 Tax=Caldicellulosiruptor diazotrophicus TaxID=2806205 RepID=A0ABM7NQB7_9FIRM|nr:hypothetical protein [Caldicellulosiruptor diazotrophicus]BCS82354.1 hypothetical protein CaldiYA01_23140 [Caldicellulosiruptor diazotrophicus]